MKDPFTQIAANEARFESEEAPAGPARSDMAGKLDNVSGDAREKEVNRILR